MSAVGELREINELLKVTQYISIGVRSNTQTLLFKIFFCVVYDTFSFFSPQLFRNLRYSKNRGKLEAWWLLSRCLLSTA